MSAGNGGPSDDSLNPWCVAAWVICVGAARDATTLAQFSSRGRSDSEYRPTVVAPGVDVITTHPTNVAKTKDQTDAEQRTDFNDRIPPERRHLYTVVSGTSFAAGTVSGIVGQLIFFVEHAIEQSPTGVRTFSHTYARRARQDPRVLERRLVGTMESRPEGLVATYPLELSPRLIKQLLMDMAAEMPGEEVHRVGAGYVDSALVHRYFDRYGVAEVELQPIRVRE
jgi:hypothetical protein